MVRPEAVMPEMLPNPERPSIKGAIYLPKNFLDNDELAKWGIVQRSPGRSPRIMSASDLLQRTGIERRFVASESENPLTMGVDVAGRLIAQVPRDKWPRIDGIYVSNSYPMGVNIADEIRRKHDLWGVSFLSDTDAACSGFVRMLRSLHSNPDVFEGKNILLMASEKESPHLEDLRGNDKPQDESLAQTIFSDGAAGIAIQYGRNFKVLSYVEKTFSREISDAIRMPVDRGKRVAPYNYVDVPQSRNGFFEQDGRRVYEFVRNEIPPLILEAIDRSGASPSDIGLVIPHQPSIKVFEALTDRTGKMLKERGGSPIEFYCDIEDGNFSSASIPKAFIKAMNEGRVKRGDRVIFAGFGAGLFASIAVVQV